MYRTDASSHPRFFRAAAGGRRGAILGLAALAILGLAGGVQQAAAQPGPRAGTRATIDANNDGVLDAQELRAAREATFDGADANRDGYLTKDELENGRMAGDVNRTSRGLGPVLRARGRHGDTMAERFERLDTDGDNRVSRNEFLAAPHPLLRFDADGDGAVTREELERARGGMRRGMR